MNLIPAEEWIESKPYSLGSAELKAIRQIQANALRWSLIMFKDDLNSPASRAIRDQANQLDPQPPTP